MREPFVRVLDADRRTDVTVVEIVSPAAKMLGSLGALRYARRRRRLLLSPVHLVEIDLLRGGRDRFDYLALPPHDYIVLSSDAARRPRGTLWPIRLDQRLPTVGVPTKRKTEATVDLQEAVDAAYGRVASDEVIEYGAEPAFPLGQRWKRWAAQRLRRRNPH